jgi:nucleoside-diphosphate-sugar epimerase
VYVDADGNHNNSPERPRYDGPIRESQATMAPSDEDYQTAEGYGANKVAAEHVLLDSGAPVSVLRAAKVHGTGATRPREWVFVKRALDRRQAILLAEPAGVAQTTAAANIAALVEVVAARPGARILNSADPDAPSVLEISRTIARQLGVEWTEVLLDGEADRDGAADKALGRTPWDAPHPIVLDMTAAASLGYVPAGDYAATVAEGVEWLVAAARSGEGAELLPAADDEFFAPMLDYAAEDRYLARRSG